MLLLQISMQLLLAMLIIVSYFHIIAALEVELYIKNYDNVSYNNYYV